MFDSTQEKSYTCSELSRLLKEQRNLERDARTIRSWMKNGVRGIKLEHIRLGGVLVSSMEAIDRFLEGLKE